MSHTPEHKEISTLGQTDEQRQASFGAVGLTVPDVSGAITSASVEPSTTPILDQQPPLPIPETQTLVSKEFTTPSGAIVSEGGDLIKEAPTDFTSELDKLIGTVESRDRAGEIAVRTQVQQRQVIEINKQIQLAQATALEAQNVAREQGETLGFAGLEQQRVARASAVEAIRLSATAQALQGNLSLANQLAGRAVDESFREEERDIEIARNNIIVNFDSFTAEEQKRAEATLLRLDADDLFLKERKADQKAIEGQVNTAAELGATNLQLEDIRNSVSEAEAIQKRVNAGLVKDVPVNSQIIDTPDGRRLLIDKSTGETIRDFGATDPTAPGSEGGIQLSSTEIRQTRERVDGEKELIDLATQYRDIIKEFGFTSTILGNKKRLGKIDSLRGQITAAFKDAKKLGTLDQGVLDLVETIIGISPTSDILFPLFTKNILGGPAKKLIGQIDSLIETTQKALTRDEARLSGGVTFGNLTGEDISEIDLILGTDFDTGQSTSSTFNPANFF